MGYSHGRPKLRKLSADIEAKGDEDRSGEDWFFDQIADGRTLRQISGDFGLSVRMLYRWRDLPEHRERRQANWAKAMRHGGEAHVERGLEELENVGKDSEGRSRVPQAAEVALAREKAGYRKWLGGKRDPQYADKGIELNFSVGQLHLEALQHTRAQVEEIEEAEVLSIEDTEAPAGIPITGGEAPSLPEPVMALPAELSELMT